MMETCDDNCECKTGDGIFAYSDTFREEFCRTSGLKFENGRNVSAAEIWRYMTVEAPARFPYKFVDGRSCEVISHDTGFFSGIKRNYLGFTSWDRMTEKIMNGRPAVSIQLGHPTELYRAAGCEPVGPGFGRMWLWRKVEGQGMKESDQRMYDLMEEYRKSLPAESCNLIASYPATCNEEVPLSFRAPCTVMRCSDIIYAMESCRDDKKLPTHIVDYPVNHYPGEWRIEYLGKQLRNLAEELGKLSGRGVTDDVLFAEIKKYNRLRKLGMECQKMWWSAKVPPTTSEDNFFSGVGAGGMGDVTAATQLLEGARDELTFRIKNGIRGLDVVDNAPRVFICGSCACIHSSAIRDASGVEVAHDDNLSLSSLRVKETGDPYYNLAQAIASLPYELPPEERGEWTAKMVRESRADGVIFVYNWGCNYQSSVSRLVTDIIGEHTGVPTTCIEVGELGRMQGSEQLRNRVEAFMEMIS
jgi:benzoyl-CoA reductase/2-hydroxyglutaryl-CoA dehydratase subunit BcrC/BadD/HgdB